MSYIGKTPTIGNFQVCDAISVVNGQAAYTMQVDSVNVVPESANHMLVSLNGILQKPGSSFTVSGSTITFASALSTGDVIDFITLLGNVLDLGVPSDATVTNAKTNFTSTSSAAGLQIKGDGTTDGTLQLNCSQNSHGIKIASPAHSAGQSYKLIFPAGNVTAGKFLKVDSVSGSGTTGVGTMTFADAGGGDCVKLHTETISANTASISFDGYFSSTYKNYLIVASSLLPDNASPHLDMRYRESSSDVTGSNYIWTQNTIRVQDSSGAMEEDNNATKDSYIKLASTLSTSNNHDGNASKRAWNFNMFLHDPLGTTNMKYFYGSSHNVYDNNNDVWYYHHHIAGTYFASANALTGFTIYPSAGNIDSGTITLYGLKH